MEPDESEGVMQNKKQNLVFTDRTPGLTPWEYCMALEYEASEVFKLAEPPR